MARGSRTSLASLASAVGENSPVERTPDPMPTPVTAALADLVANPRNPRDDLGDLGDLSSIVETQLQPALVVSRQAYLKLYPADAEDLGAARWVVVNGCRRYAAACKFGRTDLDIVVKDEIAQDRATLLAAAITENIGRRDFDVIEEAKAIELLVAECGRAESVATRLGKTPGWVSQRRSLLKLAPELQSALRRGELALRLARSLAKVPPEDQVNAWQGQRDDGGSDEKPAPKPQAPVDSARVLRTFRRLEADASVLAEALRSYLDEGGMHELLEALTAPE